jgi:flagellar biosynthesis/type III secretory pathway protein FliH
MSVGNTFSTASSKGESETRSSSADALNQLAMSFANETQGLRGQLISELSNALGLGFGGSVPTTTTSVSKSKPTPKMLSAFLNNGLLSKVKNASDAPASAPAPASTAPVNPGGNNAVNSLISKAIESSRREASKSQKQVEEELARGGLSGTPFGISQMANTIRESGFNISQIAPQMQNQMYNQALQMASNFVLGQGNSAISGLSGAIPGNQQTKTKGDAIGQSTSGSFSVKGGSR